MSDATPLPSDAFERLGPLAIRAITDELVARVAKDVLIGFFFAKTDLAALREREFEHAAELLGGSVVYRGRALEAVHHPRRIFGGQFDRRIAILRDVLVRHGVDDDIREGWLAAQRSLRPRIVVQAPTSCT